MSCSDPQPDSRTAYRRHNPDDEISANGLHEVLGSNIWPYVTLEVKPMTGNDQANLA